MSENARIRIGPLDTVGGVITEMGRVYRQTRRGELDSPAALTILETEGLKKGR